jgi:hypothetical protein
MQCSILSIVLLFTVGTAPATQPGALELRSELREARWELERMAMQWAPYGSKYPGVAEAKAEIAKLKERVAELEAASAAAPAPTTRPIDSDLLEFKMAVAGMSQTYGTKNPAVQQFNARITLMEATGARVNLDDAKTRLEALVTERDMLQKKYMKGNPAIVYVTQQIAYLESLVGDLKQNGK